MEPLTAKSSRFVCRQCMHAFRRTNNGRTVRWTTSQHLLDGRQRRPASSASRLASSTASKSAAKTAVGKTAPKTTAKSKNEKSFWENEWTVFSADNAALVKKAQLFGDRVLHAKGVPDDAIVIEAMKVIEFAAAQLTRPASLASAPTSEGARTLREQLDGQTAQAEEDRSGDGLLSLDPSKEVDAEAHPVSISISTDLLSNLAYKIIKHPPVFITPEVLMSYVHIQSSLRRPEMIPEIFELYSSKPVPSASGSNVKFSNPNPTSYKQAIPKAAADAALEAAIEKKDLDLAVAIIDSSFATRSFQTNKFITKAFPAMGGIALTPVAAGVIASQLPAYFPIANPSELVAFATVGMVTYVAGISTLGFVVITTTNDHMERVTWAPGIPLRQRWLREEERAAVDKVAISWGFKGGRQGEEQGVEWEGLREWCGLRGMILDKTELMEGME